MIQINQAAFGISISKRFAVAAIVVTTSCELLPSKSQAGEPIAKQCLNAGGRVEQLKCSIAVSEKRTKELNEQAAADRAEVAKNRADIAASRKEIAKNNADAAANRKKIAKNNADAAASRKATMEARRGEQRALDAQKCFAYLKTGVTEKKFQRDDVLKSAGGELTIENACSIAKTYGYTISASPTVP